MGLFCYDDYDSLRENLFVVPLKFLKGSWNTDLYSVPAKKFCFRAKVDTTTHFRGPDF